MRTIFLLMGILFFSGCSTIPQPQQFITMRAGVIEDLTASNRIGEIVTVRTSGDAITFPINSNSKNLDVGSKVWLRCIDYMCQVSPRQIQKGVKI